MYYFCILFIAFLSSWEPYRFLIRLVLKVIQCRVPFGFMESILLARVSIIFKQGYSILINSSSIRICLRKVQRLLRLYKANGVWMVQTRRRERKYRIQEEIVVYLTIKLCRVVWVVAWMGPAQDSVRAGLGVLIFAKVCAYNNNTLARC